MKKEFQFNGKSFEGEVLEDKRNYKIWKKNGNENQLFITTGFPSADQLVVFKNAQLSFVFFTQFQEIEGIWQVGNDVVSHYRPLLPYCAEALVLAYRVEANLRYLVEFVDATPFKGFWKFKETPEGDWIPSMKIQ